jgi:hypothetical protein
VAPDVTEIIAGPLAGSLAAACGRAAARPSSVSPTYPPALAPGGQAKTALPTCLMNEFSESCAASWRWIGMNWRRGSR